MGPMYCSKPTVEYGRRRAPSANSTSGAAVSGPPKTSVGGPTSSQERPVADRSKTRTSSAVSHTRGLSIFVRLALAILIGFAAYEVTLFAAALFLGGRETFSLAIVTQLGFMNLAWLIGIGVLNELMSTLCKSWVGVMPRLARTS